MTTPIISTIPNVTFMRQELAELLPLYSLIRDCLSGEPTVKAAGTKYLPTPNPNGEKKDEEKRYDNYKKRAVFYNVTRRTLAGLIGQVFMREPVIKVPADMEKLVENATGTGVSLIQESKRAVAFVLAYARAGVFVDYPEAPPEGATKADIDSGKYRPTINVASPFAIINWRVKPDGAEDKLSLIVMAESYVSADDGFEMKNSLQFRVLRLNEADEYVQEIWREPNAPSLWNGRDYPSKVKMFHRGQTIIPKDSAGASLKEIPFSFIGTDNNDPNPDHPNLYDLASVNIAHYRNSADYEEACFVMGQPTVAMVGLTQEWVETVLKGVVAFGSRGGIPLPVGGDAKVLQAGENTMIKEAMESKERQMVALGAKLVEQKEVQRTAFEAKVDATASSSVLASTTKNVSAAFLWALKWATKFTGGSEAEIEFKLNTDFDISRMTPEERAQAIKDWQAGAITFEEMRNALKASGIATEDDVEAKEKIAKEQVSQLALEAPFNTPTGTKPPAVPPKK